MRRTPAERGRRSRGESCRGAAKPLWGVGTTKNKEGKTLYFGELPALVGLLERWLAKRRPPCPFVFYRRRAPDLRHAEARVSRMARCLRAPRDSRKGRQHRPPRDDDQARREGRAAEGWNGDHR